MGCADNNGHMADERGARGRYPRGWARNTGYAGWKIAVAVVMLLGVPIAIWLLITFLFR